MTRDTDRSRADIEARFRERETPQEAQMTAIERLRKMRDAATKGDWQRSGSRGATTFYGHDIGPDGNPVAKVDYPPPSRFVSPEKHAECTANAVLIAAAPQLAELLADALQALAMIRDETLMGKSDGLSDRINALTTLPLARAAIMIGEKP